MVVIGEVTLKKGKNTFVFSQTPTSGKTGAYNFQAMIIFADGGNVEWYVPGPDDHETVFVPAKAATCVAEGNIAYYACSHCSKIFSDVDAVNEITDASTVKTAIDPENHANTTLGEDKATLTCNDCKKFVMYTFDGMDDRCVVTGVDKNDNEKCIPGKNGTVSTITYYIVSDKDVTLPMYVNCSAIAGSWKVEFYKTWGVKITAPDGTFADYQSNTVHHNDSTRPSTIANRFSYYLYEYVADVTLKAGKNTIVFTGTAKEQLNFRNLGFKNPGDAKLSWGTAE